MLSSVEKSAVSSVPVQSKNLFKLCDVVILVGSDEIGHSQNLRVVLIGLCLSKHTHTHTHTHEGSSMNYL